MPDWKYHVTPNAMRELLRGGGEYDETALLNDLTPEQATRVPDNAPYSIATLVAHMTWNLQENLAAIGAAEGSLLSDNDVFPVIAPEDWETVRADFFLFLSVARSVPPGTYLSDSMTNPDTSVAYDLAEMSLHNAYHFGQIVLLRRILGHWPPAAKP